MKQNTCKIYLKITQNFDNEISIILIFSVFDRTKNYYILIYDIFI
jgi:hypothetical protein